MRIRPLLLCLGLFWLTASVSAAAFQPDLSRLDTLPMHSLPAMAVAKAVASAQSKTTPYQFAVGAALPLTLDDGVWQQVDAATWSWRTRVFSGGAQTLNFEFAKFRMPSGGQLWIYDAAGQRLEGPYTHANENAEGTLWTAVVPGDTVVLEARVPTAARDRLQLQLKQANHGFRGFGKSTAGQTSGACEIDVACPQADGWRSDLRAIGRISIGGTLLCSGQLVNNTRQDNDPLFLTANHCSIEQAGGGPASSVVVYWNYVNNQCGSGADSGLNQNQTGSTLVAQDRGSDFTLIRLSQKPPAAYNLYYAGWDASGTDVPQSGAVMHHPQGDVKKISLYTKPGSKTSTVICEGAPLGVGVCQPGTTRNIQAWQINYAQGVTEQGSSGSGLFNQNHQIVGVLSGGNSDCNNLGGTDYYGRTEVAWTANAAASGQLKANLDPDNTGTLTLPGKDANAVAANGAAGVAGASGNGGGGGLPPLTLAGLAALRLLRRGRIEPGSRSSAGPARG